MVRHVLVIRRSGVGITEAVAFVSDPRAVSFLENPVIIVENFWSAEERQYFREGMNKAMWKSLEDLPHVREDFPNSGNWAKAEIPSSRANDSCLGSSCLAFRITLNPFPTL
jgi:SM-20-related protein